MIIIILRATEIGNQLHQLRINFDLQPWMSVWGTTMNDVMVVCWRAPNLINKSIKKKIKKLFIESSKMKWGNNFIYSNSGTCLNIIRGHLCFKRCPVRGHQFFWSFDPPTHPRVPFLWASSAGKGATCFVEHGPFGYLGPPATTHQPTLMSRNGTSSWKKDGPLNL